MAFMNEYISPKDMDFFDIRNLWRVFHPSATDESLDSIAGPYSWTVDKEKNIFLIPVRQGRYEESNQKLFALWWQGSLLSVTLEQIDGNLDYPNKTGFVIWGLVNIWRPSDVSISDEDIIKELKSALIVYQLGGVSLPMTDYSVDFNF